jgi:hypothetical protein
VVLDIVGAVKGHFARDEFVQFFGVVVSGIKGECVWGEVFAGLGSNSGLIDKKKK